MKSNPQFSIVVPVSNIEPFLIPHVHYLQNNVNWGGYSQISATIALLREIERLGIKIDYIHFISGQDYPLFSNDIFDKFFEFHSPTSFMYFCKNQEWMKRNLPSRYRCYHLNDYLNQRSNNYFIRNFSKLFSKVQVFPCRNNIPNIAYGHNWFSWHKHVSDFVLNYLDSHSEYEQRFHYTNCCDELFFHTILYQHVEKLHIETNTSLRYIDWSRPKMLLTEQDYKKIMASGDLFCRKIDPTVSKGLKEMIRTHIRG